MKPAIVTTSLAGATCVAVASMVHGAGKFEWNPFYPWVTAPYVLLALMFLLPGRQSVARSRAGCVAAVLVLLFSAFLYAGAMWFSTSSTSALVFVIGPVYVFALGAVTWLIVWYVLSRKRQGG